MRFELAEISRDVMLAAIATRQRFEISYWDAAILEAARSLGCEAVLSEDLSAAPALSPPGAPAHPRWPPDRPPWGR